MICAGSCVASVKYSDISTEDSLKAEKIETTIDKPKMQSNMPSNPLETELNRPEDNPASLTSIDSISSGLVREIRIKAAEGDEMASKVCYTAPAGHWCGWYAVVTELLSMNHNVASPSDCHSPVPTICSTRILSLKGRYV